MYSKKLLQITLIAAILIFSLVILATLAYKRLKNVVEYTQSVNQNADFVHKLEEVLSLLKDCEVGNRGFMITHDSTFLQPYYVAKSTLPSTLADLFANAANQDIQSKSLDSVRRMTYERLGILEYTMTQTKENTEERHLSMQRGKAKMDDLRVVAGDLKAQQMMLLKIQKDEQKDLLSTSPHIFLFIIGSAFLLIFIAIYIIIRQIYLLIEYQKKLENKIVELAYTNAELDLYAFNLTHDLQEPLRKIRLFMTRFESKNAELFAQKPDFKPFSKKINDLAHEGQTKLAQFMAFANLTQRIEHKQEAVDLNQVVALVLAEKNALIVRKNAAINVENLPIVNGNAQQLTLLFEHLMDNALKFTASERPLSIDIKNVPSENLGFVKITIKDNGIGIENTYNNKIFDIFTRLNGREEFEGMGVGLAICRRIVTLHKGHISVTSQLGEGSVFEVHLPLC